MNKEELLGLVGSLKIDPEEYVICSSGALTLRGILSDAHDLDIAVTTNGLNVLKNNYNLIAKPNGWYTVDENVECILNDNCPKEKLGDYYVQDIYDYMSYLETSERQKDKLRIPMVREYIKNR